MKNMRDITNVSIKTYIFYDRIVKKNQTGLFLGANKAFSSLSATSGFGAPFP